MSNITMKCERDGCSTLGRTLTMEKAMEMLVVYELGYGGQIQEIQDDLVKVRTRVFGAIDNTTFIGSNKDMELLVKTALLSVEVGKVKTTDAEISKVVDKTDGNPFLIEHGAGMILGHGRARVTTLMLFEEVAEELHEKLLKLTLTDLVSLAIDYQQQTISKDDLNLLIN